MAIEIVVRLENNMVVVFDADGEQVTEYQGEYQYVRSGILKDASLQTVFAHWFGYSLEPQIVSRESW